MEPIIAAFKNAVIEIATYLRDSGASSTERLETLNEFGEVQLGADVFADQALFRHMQGLVISGCSEENTTPVPLGGERYCVTWDPLDGSSIIDTNFAVGTIFGLWDVQDLNGATGRDLVFSTIVVYGPKTTMLIEIDGENGERQVDELTLVRGEWITTKTKLTVKPETKLFAPANLRAVNEHPGYRELVTFWESNAYTLRYTGGMVPDVYQIFIKGHGVFANPATEVSPPKLRLLYECAPMAKLMELAGGRATCGNGPVLDVRVEGYNQKIQMCLGSVTEVERFEKYTNP